MTHLVRLLTESPGHLGHGVERVADLVLSPLGQVAVQFGVWWWGK